MAMLCAGEYPFLDISRVVKMCLVHDFGEAITGDIPAFLKTSDDEVEEDKAIARLISSLPSDIEQELSGLFAEMSALETDEARLFKSLDNMEALISHNEADISTWLPREYEENLTYGQKNVQWSDWMQKLKAEINQDSIEKINTAKEPSNPNG